MRPLPSQQRARPATATGEHKDSSNNKSSMIAGPRAGRLAALLRVLRFCRPVPLVCW